MSKHACGRRYVMYKILVNIRSGKMTLIRKIKKAIKRRSRQSPNFISWSSTAEEY